MAEFQDVVKAYKRLCDEFALCINCPLYNLVKTTSFCANGVTKFYSEEAERIIMKWAKENPEPDKDLDELKKLLRDDKITINQLVKWVVEGYKRTEEKR